MAPRSFAEMQPRERRQALVRVVTRIVVVWIVVIGAYFIAPIGNDTTLSTIVKLVIDLALVIGIIFWQVRQVLHADLPEVRAMEALGAIVVVFLVLFAALYLSMSHYSSPTFTQPLDHVRALYFTVTVFSTVGFGDITAKTDAARAVVSVQMIFDLVLIGAVARLLLTAARSGLGRSSAGSQPHPKLAPDSTENAGRRQSRTDDVENIVQEGAS